MRQFHACTLFAAALLTLGSCGAAYDTPDPSAQASEHNARNALDWTGAYRGVLSCADCAGIDTVVVLNGDGTFKVEARLVGQSGESTVEYGRFTWDESGTNVRLDTRAPVSYFVAENRLILVEREGARPPGVLAGGQVLSKINGEAPRRSGAGTVSP